MPSMVEDEESPAQEASSIQRELQILRGDLFDIADADSSVGLILKKVQQLTDYENRVIDQQRNDIEALTKELEKLRQEESRVDAALESVPSFGSAFTMDSDDSQSILGSGGFTTDSERLCSYSLQTNELLAQKATLTQSVAVIQEDIAAATIELRELTSSKEKIEEDIDHLRERMQVLMKERTTLIQEVEVYTDSNGQMQCEVETLREIACFDKRALDEKLATEAALREEAEDKAATETMIRQEMQREIKILYEEKIACEKELADLKEGVDCLNNHHKAVVQATDIQRLKNEIKALQGENESLRSTAKRDSEMIAGLNDEIRSIHSRTPSGPPTPTNTPQKGNTTNSFSVQVMAAAASRKRALVLSQGPVQPHREAQRQRVGSSGSVSLEIISGPSRERLDTASALSESDGAALESDGLFGQESVPGNDDDKSDHDGVRAHAEKVLYWANRASERSSQQSSANKSSRLPPRCPPAPSSVSQDVGGDGNTTKSDKENGGTTFNREVLGAFPTMPPKPKKNVRLSENDTIIDNLDYVDETQVVCCECSASPFSGNDPQADLFLPKLGLACTCGASLIEEERLQFSKNPTALRNILRPWQCDFLSTLSVFAANELLKAHKKDANGMARSMKKWRASQGMAACRSKECYVALKVWSRTCKVVLRSIRHQKENAAVNEDEDVVIEKPHFLDITFGETGCSASISTLGQLSSVGGGGRPFEMMEI